MSNNTEDILKIDEMIKKQLMEDQKKTKDFYHDVIKNIDQHIKTTTDTELLSTLKNEKNNIEDKILDISNAYDFYLSESIELIEQYKKILKIPKKISFMGKSEDVTINEKINIIKKFKNIARKYIFIENTENKKCNNCGVSIIQSETTDDYVKICDNCSSHQQIQTISITYRDTTRAHGSSKYAYDRKSHFRECINQYQGKQCVSIPPKVYDLLYEKISFNNLLTGDEKSERHIRYSKVTKKNILLFLKELNLPKQYENLNLIYSVVTGNKLNDISHIVPCILNDFDTLIETYDTVFSDINRKNFINTQYVLFQLLRKHNHPCQKEDFSNIKTIDRKFFHEHILKTLFQKLGWNYTSIF